MLIAEIIKHANEFYGINIKEETRATKISYARFIVMKYLKYVRGFSYPRISRCLGLKDHTTAMNGVAKVNDDVTLTVAYNDFIESLNDV